MLLTILDDLEYTGFEHLMESLPLVDGPIELLPEYSEVTVFDVISTAMIVMMKAFMFRCNNSV